MERLLNQNGFSVLEVHDETEVFPPEKFDIRKLGKNIKRALTSCPNMIIVAQKS